MHTIDLLHILKWWSILFGLGIIFFPISSQLFSSFFDKGYAFSKIIAFLIVSYTVFILGILHLLPFTYLYVLTIIAIWGGINYFFFVQPHTFSSFFSIRKFIVIILDEALLLLGIVVWAYIRSFQPDINGLEKFMDFGFVNSILRAEYFPPKDMWFTPFSINYYYFGHLITAVLTKVSQLPASVTYNLMLATIAGFAMSTSFSIGLHIYNHLHVTKKGISTGILAALLVTFGGNLHTLYTFFTPYQTENPVPLWQLTFSPDTFPNAYWYPNATRFIYHTIHEFPLYSFVVSDLHGHVLGILIVLTIIALALHELLFASFFSTKRLIFFSFLIASAYMTNAWDGIIYLLLTIFTLFSLKYIHFSKNSTHPLQFIQYIVMSRKNIVNFLTNSGVLFIGFLIFSFPFSLYFKPFVSGIGVLCSPTLLTNIGKIGPFLFEANHCQRSPVWQLIMLYGFFFFWVFILYLNILKKKTILRQDFFIIILIVLSTILLIIPEFIYVKDIYPEHYRANTMFKLAYQAFIMLSIVSAYSIVRFFSEIKKSLVSILLSPIGFVSIILVMMYPVFAINSYYSNLQTYHQLDGTTYLTTRYPSDFAGIQWLNTTVQGQPVILEAQGDSYTDYARVSANTGLPTVLGWTVHEWLWRGTYDIPAPRITDIKNMYESSDITFTKQLLKNYNISYVFIGDLERQKYPLIQESKFQQLGTVVFQKGMTKIYKIY